MCRSWVYFRLRTNKSIKIWHTYVNRTRNKITKLCKYNDVAVQKKLFCGFNCLFINPLIHIHMYILRYSTAHRKILVGEKLVNCQPFAKIFLTNVHRYIKNVFGICTDYSLFAKSFLTNSFTCVRQNLLPPKYFSYPVVWILKSVYYLRSFY